MLIIPDGSGLIKVCTQRPLENIYYSLLISFAFDFSDKCHVFIFKVS